MNQREAVAIAAEGALISLSIVTVIALERLFVDTSFLREILIMVIGSHLVAIVVRRADLSMVWSTLISCVTLVLLGAAVFYPDSANLIIPTGDTLTILGDDLREAWQVFSDDAAPVPPLRGFLVTTSVLVWYGIFLADWAAFRLRSPLEAIAPATSVFVFAALLGVDRNQVTHGSLYAAGVVAVLLAMRAERQLREEVWVASGSSAGVSTTLRVGAITGLVAVIAGGVIAPSLPGAGADPLIDINDLDRGGQTRFVTSPLVEISASLVEQSDQEIFSVKVAKGENDYWRLMALTEFDGGIWRRSSNFEDVRGPVSPKTDGSIPTTTLRQEITTKLLGNIYLPAAYEVTNIVDSQGIDLEYESATGALVVKEDFERQAELGFTYIIESSVPDYSPDQLPADATEGLDEDFVAEHTQLPPACGQGESAVDGCWPESVNQPAREVTAGATTDHQRILLLQDYFTKTGGFTYNLGVALQHSVKDVEDFLDLRQGYCEQFASTFAAMARSLGIPTRVAVGFTWGEWDEARQEYVVRGRHAHAWPEVFFAGAGWVVFDPTPGRSRPHDADITNQPVGLQYPANELADSAATTVPVDDQFLEGPIDTRPRPSVTAPDLGGAIASSAEAGGVPTAVWIVLVSTIALIAAVATAPTVHTLRRRRRLARVAADPVGRGELAWDDAVEALQLLGITPSVPHTPLEFAAVVARSRLAPTSMVQLAEEVTLLRYAALDDAVEHALAAQAASTQVVAACHEHVGRRAVVLASLDPRSLLPAR